MGDFNDYPTNRSLSVDLSATQPVPFPKDKHLYNLMLPFCGDPDVGTNKYQAEWGILDQIIVSGNLLKKAQKAHIFSADFLLIQDERWLGRKPFRTYHGMSYQGGFSDHLPVFADLEIQKFTYPFSDCLFRPEFLVFGHDISICTLFSFFVLLHFLKIEY
jgi:hypothetical protein